jgi:hypothetical protein
MMPCDEREPGPGCQATEPGAHTRNMAILGALAVLRRNAVVHAMGRRVRDLSITAAKLLGPE